MSGMCECAALMCRFSAFRHYKTFPQDSHKKHFFKWIFNEFDVLKYFVQFAQICTEKKLIK